MGGFKNTLHYLSHLQWTEKKQLTCTFCKPGTLNNYVYEDDDIIAVENIRKAGLEHWLIIPKVGAARHIRDCEALTEEDIPLLKAMDTVKEQLLREHYPNTPRSAILAGYHRGRRQFIGPVIFPDIVSIHHLHLHVIIEPRASMALFKYPNWLPLMWVSDRSVMDEVKGRKKPEVHARDMLLEQSQMSDVAGTRS